MNCFGRLSNLLSTEPLEAQVKVTVENEDTMDTTDAGTGKRQDKVPAKAKKKKKYGVTKRATFGVTKSPWQKTGKKISSKSNRSRPLKKA